MACGKGAGYVVRRLWVQILLLAINNQQVSPKPVRILNKTVLFAKVIFVCPFIVFPISTIGPNTTNL